MLQAALGDSNIGFLNNSMSTSTTTSPEKVPSPPTDHRYFTVINSYSLRKHFYLY